MFSYSSNIYNSIRKISKCFIQSVAPREDGVSVIHHRLCKTIEQYYTGVSCNKMLEVQPCPFRMKNISSWKIRLNFRLWPASQVLEHGTHLIVLKLFNIIIINQNCNKRIVTELCQSTIELQTSTDLRRLYRGNVGIGFFEIRMSRRTDKRDRLETIVAVNRKYIRVCTSADRMAGSPVDYTVLRPAHRVSDGNLANALWKLCKRCGYSAVTWLKG